MWSTTSFRARGGAIARLEAEVIGAEQADQSADDQIDGDDIVQQPRHHQNENPCDQRYEGTKTQCDRLLQNAIDRRPDAAAAVNGVRALPHRPARNSQPMFPIMNKHQVKGRIKEAEGKIKKATGRIIDNKRLEEKGKAQKTAGKVQAVYGDIKKNLNER